MLPSWGPAKNSGPADALVASVKDLKAEVAKLGQTLKAKDGNGSGNADKQSDGGKRCFGCGKPGFTKRTCPDCKDKSKSGSGSSNSNSNANGKSDSSGGKWAPPKDGEPAEKEIDGVTHKFCQSCRRGKGKWSKGDAAHFTKDHQVGFKKDKDGEASGKVAAADQSLFSASAWNSGFSQV